MLLSFELNDDINPRYRSNAMLDTIVYKHVRYLTRIKNNKYSMVEAWSEQVLANDDKKWEI